MRTLQVTNKKYHLIFKHFLNIFIAFMFLFFSFLYRSQANIKSIVVDCVRESVKINMQFNTWNWYSLGGDNFLIKYNNKDDEKKIAPMVLQIAEENFQDVNKMLEYQPKDKTIIIVYPNKAELNKSFGWDADANAMGVYFAGVIRIVSPNDWLKNDGENLKYEFRKNGPIIHEYAHLLVDYKTRGNYTRWFTEGIAQYVEREITGFVFPDVNIMNKNELYYFEQMDENFDNLPNQQLAYSQSLAAIDFIVENYGYDKLMMILTNLGNGKNITKAFYESTGETFIDYTKKVNELMSKKYLLN